MPKSWLKSPAKGMGTARLSSTSSTRIAIQRMAASFPRKSWVPAYMTAKTELETFEEPRRVIEAGIEASRIKSSLSLDEFLPK